MDFFSKLGETLSGAGRDVSKRAKDLTESTKMDIDIRAKESYINKQYTSIGKKYFEMHENDEEPLFEEVELIREAKAEIQRMQDLLVEKKGMKKCPSCQAIIQQNVQFCPHCGTKCEMPVEEEAAAEAPAEEVVPEAPAEEMAAEAPAEAPEAVTEAPTGAPTEETAAEAFTGDAQS